MSDGVERVSVTITVTGVKQVRGREPLIGLAVVELDVAGVVIILQGVQVLRMADGSLACKPPQFRRPTGVWAPAAVLPADLAEALGAEVLHHPQGGQAPSIIPPASCGPRVTFAAAVSAIVHPL